ncbi:MAG: class I fructose-bisphosphate aldolase [Betaproteobacteria bacterium]
MTKIGSRAFWVAKESRAPSRERAGALGHRQGAGDKGLLAMDECDGTCNKRLPERAFPGRGSPARVPGNSVTTPGLDTCIGGAILYDETVRQKTTDGTPSIPVLADAGIMPGMLPALCSCREANPANWHPPA